MADAPAAEAPASSAPADSTAGTAYSNQAPAATSAGEEARAAAWAVYYQQQQAAAAAAQPDRRARGAGREGTRQTRTYSYKIGEIERVARIHEVIGDSPPGRGGSLVPP